MSLKVKDVIEIPDAKPNLVVKVGEINQEDRKREYVREYVITDYIAKSLQAVIKAIAESAEKGFGGYGIWVEGSFGSGKSHFLSFSGMLLRGDKEAWEKDHQSIRELGGQEAILEKNRVLVVPVNAQDVRDDLRKNIYQCLNAELERYNHNQAELSSAKKVVSWFEKFASELQGLWEHLFGKSLEVRSMEDFTRLKAENIDLLASEIARYVQLPEEISAGSFYVEMKEGIQRITSQLKSLGYKALVFLVDELTLFLQNVMNKGQPLTDLNRLLEQENAAVPVWAVVARHQPLEDVVREEAKDTLDHLKGRFQKTLDIKDVDLYQVCAERVLKRTSGAEEKLTSALEENLTLLPQDQLALLAEIYRGEGNFRQILSRLYPFHPSIIDTLVSVTHRLSRERTGPYLLCTICSLTLQKGIWATGSLIIWLSITLFQARQEK